MPISRLRPLAVLVAAAVAGALLGSPVAATAAVPGSCTNAACPDPTDWAHARWNAHAGYPSNGGTVDGANCTNYVAWRLMRTGGFTEDAVRGLGNASTWDTRAADKGYTVDRLPAVGAVAQWDANHVAYVEQVNTDGTIVISESNVWVGTAANRMWLRHRVIAASAVDHFIHLRPPALKRVIAPGDFDGDGLDDLLVVVENGRLELFRGDGRGGVLDPAGTVIGTGWASRRAVFAVGDFSGDGPVDVMAIAQDGTAYLYPGGGHGGLLPRTKVRTGWSKVRFVFSPGDFSGDGRPDVLIVRADGKLVSYRGNGSGGWKSKAVVVPSNGFSRAAFVGSPGDFDGDGKADVIALWSDGTLKLYRGNGKNGLLNKKGIVIATGWKKVTGFTGSGDLTGDGPADLIALRGGTRLDLHPGDGSTLAPEGTPLSVTW